MIVNGAGVRARVRTLSCGRSHASIFQRQEGESNRMQAAIVNVVADGANQFAHRAAPIALSRPALEIAAAIVNGRPHFVGVAAPVQRNVKKEIAESIT